MLLSAGRHRHETPTGVDTIHNYYEHLVLDEIFRISERARSDMEFLADCACVALNHLPPRYIRHDVDMTFFMSVQEQQEIAKKVGESCKKAIDYVTERSTEEPTEDSDSTENEETTAE